MYALLTFRVFAIECFSIDTYLYLIYIFIFMSKQLSLTFFFCRKYIYTIDIQNKNLKTGYSIHDTQSSKFQLYFLFVKIKIMFKLCTFIYAYILFNTLKSLLKITQKMNFLCPAIFILQRSYI